MTVNELANGSAIISDGNTVLVPWIVYVRILDQVYMVKRASTGLAWTPIVKLAGTSDASAATPGDYEIALRRVKPKTQRGNSHADQARTL